MESFQKKQDIVIVGGGIIGICTAYYLTQQPNYDASLHTITVVEGERPAAAASGKAGGLLSRDWHGPTTDELARLSYRLHAELAEQYGGREKESGWQYRELDTFNVHADLRGDDLKTKEKAVREHEFGSEEALANEEEEEEKVERVLPEPLCWLDQSLILGGQVIGNKDSTCQIHPWVFTTKFLSLAQENGVELLLGTVDSVARTPSEPEADSNTASSAPLSPSSPWTVSGTLRPPKPSSSEHEPQLATHTSFTLPADHIIICAGPWTGTLLTSLFPSPSLIGGRARNITGHRAHSVLFKPVVDHALPIALFTTLRTSQGDSEPEIYCRPDGTIYACGPTDGSLLPENAAEVVVETKAIETLKEQMGKLAPGYLAGDPVREQACYLPVFQGFKATTEPVIAKVDDGIYVASGHGCWGIAHAPATGILIAELVMQGKASSASLEPFQP